MDNLNKILENEINSLTQKETEKLLSDLRDEINKLDKSIVQLLNKRTLFAVYIGRVKSELGIPYYSPEREKEISQKINSYLEEPLTKQALQRIYERIIDESRAIQKVRGSLEKIFKSKNK